MKLKIIGRTKFDHYNLDTIKKVDNYFVSSVAHRFIIENQINKLPINIKSLIKNNGWALVPYNKTNKYIKNVDPCLFKNNWGFTLHHLDKFVIFYDTSVSIESQRFTLAHEIGHIMLSHFVAATNKIEIEANIFACKILMPMCVLYKCNAINQSEISKLCMVSYSAATYSCNRYSEILKNGNYNISKLEYKIVSQFKQFINNYLQNKQKIKSP